MARVTVEDCVEVVPNRFELVLMAARRARELSSGASVTIDRDNDRNPVIALREIAEQTIPLSALKDAIVRSLQRATFRDESDEELETEFLDALSGSIALPDDDGEDIAEHQMQEADATSHLNVVEEEEAI